MPLTNYTFQQLIDFTRTSSATFVGSDGLVQNTPASVNLLTYTQEFDNAAWTKLNGVVTANNTTAPDGTATADTFSDETATNVHGVRLPANPALSTTYAVSVYAKMGTRRYVSLSVSAASSAALYASVSFDLQSGAVVNTGAVGTGFSVVSSAIENAGNGWYRCIAVLAFGSAGTLPQAYISTGTDGSIGGFGLQNYTGTNGTVFIWGAQLETGSTATTYTRNVGGLFPARFDYDPVTLAPRGILIEEQRTNLLIYSNEFTNAAWFAGGTTITPNTVISPDGAQNADTVFFPAAANQNIQYTTPATVTAGQSYTASVYIRADAPVSNVNFTFVGYGDLTTPAITTTWQRFTVTVTAGGTTLTPILVTRNSVATTIYIYGFQLEAGAFATSYIPTVASQVTRTADQASIVAPMFAPWYNQTEGTFVAEWAPYVTGNFNAFSATDGTTLNRIQVTGSNSFQFLVGTSNVVQALIDAGTVNVGAVNKVAGAYRANDFAASLNNSAAITDTAGTVPTVTRFDIGNLAISFEYLNGHIRRITYYPVRLLDTQLQALTA